MSMRTSAVFALALLLSPTLAGADTLAVFNFNSTYLLDGSQVVGTATVDTTTGAFTSVDINIDAHGSFYSFSGAPFAQGTLSSGIYYANSSDGNADSLGLRLPVATLVNYAGGSLCVLSSACNGFATPS